MKNSVNKKALAVLLAAVLVFEGMSGISVAAQESAEEQLHMEVAATELKTNEVLVPLESTTKEEPKNPEQLHVEEQEKIQSSGGVAQLSVDTIVTGNLGVAAENNYHFANEGTRKYVVYLSDIVGNGKIQITMEKGSTQKTYIYDINPKVKVFELNEEAEYNMCIYTTDSTLSYSLVIQEAKNVNEGVENEIPLVTHRYIAAYVPEKSGMYTISERGGWSIGKIYDDDGMEMYGINEGNRFYLKKNEKYYIEYTAVYRPKFYKIEVKEYVDFAENIINAGNCGTNAIYTLNSNGTMEIKGTGEIKRGSWAENLTKQIKKVIIGEGITDITSGTFMECKNLKDVIIPSTVKHIDKSAFINTLWLKNKQSENPLVIVNNMVIDGEKCSGNIVIPDGVHTISDSAFINYDNPSKLTKIQLPNTVTSIGDSAFFGCSNLTKIEYKGKSKLTTIGNFAFYKTGIKDFVIPESLKWIGGNVFQFCEALEKVSFEGDNNLTYVGGSAFNDTAWYKKQGKGFVTLGDFLIGYEGTEKEITIPDNIKVIGVYALSENKNLEKVVMSDNTKEILEYSFYNCTKLKEVTVPGSVTKVTYDAFSSCTALENVVIENGVQEIGKEVFQNCSNLKKIEIPKSVVKIGERGIGYLYETYDSTTSKWVWMKAGTLPTIYCYSSSAAYKYAVKNELPYNLLKEKSLKNATVTFEKKEYAYNGKKQKPKVKVVLNGKTLKQNVDYTVSYKNNTDMGTAKAVVSGVGNYKGSITKKFSIVWKNGTIVEVDKYKYKLISSKEVSFEGLNSSKTTKVTIPKTVKIAGKTLKVTSISNNALKKTEITSVSIGSNVKTIGNSAFEGCSKLTKVTIGSGVIKIGSNTFKNCKKLGQVTIKSAKLKTVGKNSFKGIKSNAKIKVLSKKISSYKKLLKNKGQDSKVKILK